MWMMGCSDGGEFNIPAADSFNGRKPRPLIPRTPMPCSNNSPPAATLGRLHGNDFFSLNHHLANMGEQGKRDLHTQQVVVSSRWNPTPEQLRTLEELYRRGTRTPSTEQIQHITAQLRKYGKIEGKNVFYWFQNHKARERQKRRREMESAVPDHQHQLNPQQHQHPPDIEIFERKESGANRTTGYEGEQIKNWAASTNCSTLPEESISRQRAAKGAMGECREADGWFELEEVEFQHRKNFMERNGTWQMMQLCCPSPTTHLINATSTNCNTSTTASTLAAAATATTISTPTAASAPTIRTMDPKLIKTRTHDLNIFIAPYYNTENGYLFNEEDNGCGESQTLQLFPLRSCGSDANESINDKETETSSAAMNANFTPYQFFEFLPLKN